MRLRILWLAAAIAVVPIAGADAQGNRYGWCNGNGNPHQSACSPPTTTTGSTTSGPVPVVNQQTGTTTGGGTTTTGGTTTGGPTAGGTTTGAGASSGGAPKPLPQLTPPDPKVPAQVTVVAPPDPVIPPQTTPTPMAVPPQLPPGQVPTATPSQVPQLPSTPQLTPQPMPVPQQLPPGQVPTATPGQVPQLPSTPEQTPQPMAVPQQVPQQVPTPVAPVPLPNIPQRPTLRPTPTSTGTPTTGPVTTPGGGVPTAKPQTPTVSTAVVPPSTTQPPLANGQGGDHPLQPRIDATTPTVPSLGSTVVVLRGGRQQPDQIVAVDQQRLLQCVASGYGRRMVKRADGSLAPVGLIGLLRLPDAILQDIPANRLRTADCMMTIDRRTKRQSGR